MTLESWGELCGRNLDLVTCLRDWLGTGVVLFPPTSSPELTEEQVAYQVDYAVVRPFSSLDPHRRSVMGDVKGETCVVYYHLDYGEERPCTRYEVVGTAEGSVAATVAGLRSEHGKRLKLDAVLVYSQRVGTPSRINRHCYESFDLYRVKEGDFPAV